MAKRTAENDIEQMISDRIIAVFTQKTRKCYALKGDDMFEGNLPVTFSKKIEAIKEKLESMEKKFETHSYDAQLHMHDELCKTLTTQIERSKEWVKDLDQGYDEYSNSYYKIYSDVTKLLKKANIDRDRYYKILHYLNNVTHMIEVKNRTVDELDKKREV